LVIFRPRPAIATPKALGLSVLSVLLARADEVIE
jgi:hypothetical protein